MSVFSTCTFSIFFHFHIPFTVLSVFPSLHIDSKGVEVAEKFVTPKGQISLLLEAKKHWQFLQLGFSFRYMEVCP